MKKWVICVLMMLITLVTVSAFATENMYPAPEIELYSDEITIGNNLEMIQNSDEAISYQITLDASRYLRYQAIQGTLNWDDGEISRFEINVKGYNIDIGYDDPIASQTIFCDREQREAEFVFTGAEIDDLFDGYYYSGEIDVTAYAPDYPACSQFQSFDILSNPINAPVLYLTLPEVITPDDETSLSIPYRIEPGSYPFHFTTLLTAYDTSKVSIGSEEVIITDAGYSGTIRIPDEIMDMNPAFIGIEIQNFQDAIDREGTVDTDLSGLIRVPTNLQSWGTWGDLDWAVSNTGVLTICGTDGMNSFASGSTDAWQAEKENILSVVIEEGVNSIGAYAFSGFSNLTSVTIADSVKGIWERAFYGCSSLSAVDLGENLGTIGPAAFAYCSSLESITLPESLTDISESAFESCTELASIVIPDSVTWIIDNAFRNCTSLTQISIGKGVQMIPKAAFSGCTALQNVEIDADAKIETIYTDAFSGCTSLASFPFPDSTYVIYDNAFNGCTSLTSVSIPAGVVKIFESSFRNCTSLTEIQVHADNTAYSAVDGLLLDKAGVTLIAYPAGRNDTNLVIPAGVKTIGPGVFYGCTGLTSINLNEVNSVSDEAFFGCTGLENLIAPNGVFGVGNNAFANCDSINTVNYLGQEITLNGIFASGKSGGIGYLFGNNKTLLFMGNGVPASDLTASSVPVWKTGGVKWVIVPDYIYMIYQYTFYGCTSLESVSIGKDLSQIGKYAFSGCTAMREITFTGNCYSIDNYAFSDCTALTGITLPDSCYSIGNYVFDNCTSLAEIHLPDNCYSVGDYAFHDCTSLTSVSLPAGVTSIGDYAFYGCSSISGTMSIPKSVEEIGRDAFRGCAGLTAFAVDPDNTAYASENGALYDMNISTLIAFPRAAGGHYVMPDSVTTIKDDALILCSELNSVTFGNGISQIGASTFFGCYGLNAIHISQSITSIDKNSFASCSNLTEITVDPGNTVYASLNGVLFSKDLTKLYHYPEGRDGDYSIPSGVTTIDEYAFKQASKLTSITIPESVSVIGDHAFQNCGQLVFVTIMADQPAFGETVFSGCNKIGSFTYQGRTVIPGGIIHHSTTDGVSILYGSSGDVCFFGSGSIPFSSSNRPLWYGIRRAYIFGGISAIEAKAFDNCYMMTGITFGDTVKSIGQEAFRGCIALTDISWGRGLESIGAEAFRFCTALETLTIPGGVSIVDSNAFNQCTSLKNVTVENRGTIIADNAFSLVEGITDLTIPSTEMTGLFSESKETVQHVTILPGATEITASAFTDFTALTTISIPDSVTAIGSNAFGGCSLLADVIIPENVAVIGNSAFNGCAALQHIEIPEGVTGIGDFVFNNCSTLTGIGIPDSVITIGTSAFSGCELLSSIEIPDSVTTIGESAFNGCAALTSIEIPNSVSTIGDFAFNSCAAMTGIVIPESVTAIGESAFSGCTSLTGITIPVCNSYTHQWAKQHCFSAFVITHQLPTTDPAVAPTCEETGLTEGQHCGECEEILLAQETVPALGHDWHDPVYEWAEDQRTLTATRVCDRDPEHTETETADVSAEITLQPTCEIMGQTTYTSEAFTNPVFLPQTQTKTDIDALGHAWTETIYTWSEDETTVTANRVCGHDAGHIQTETVSTVKVISPVPTENTAGAFTTTSMEFLNPDFEQQAKTESIPAIKDMHVLSLPAALTTIESEAFANLENVDAVRVPEYVAFIADDAFDKGMILIVPAGSYAEEWAAGKDGIYSIQQP